MASELTGKPATVVLLASGKDSLHLVFSRSADLGVDMRKAMEAAARMVDGKGGGKPDVCQGGGKNPAGAGDALKEAEKVVEAMLRDDRGQVDA